MQDSRLVCLLIAVLSAALQFGGDSAHHWLRYDLEAVLGGEIWRLLSGHFVHLGWNHCLLNLAGVCIVILGFPHMAVRRPQRLVADLAVLSLATGAGLLLFSPGVRWYVGLSGVLHGLVVIAALSEWRRQRWLALLLLAAVAGKLLWEQWAGAAAATVALIGAPVIVDAHLYGAVAGLLWAAVRRDGVRR